MNAIDYDYPEHAKMRAVHDEAQKLGAFLEWIESGSRRIAERIDAYTDGLHRIIGGYPEQQMVSDLRAVLADADRDRQFAEAVRDEVYELHGHCPDGRRAHDCIIQVKWLDAEHQRIYGTPCAAKEKA